MTFRQFNTILFILLYFQSLKSQIIPKFEVDTHEGCTPLVVNFINKTIPDSNINFFWDFGNFTYSTLKNPSTIYIQPGVYVVKLLAYTPTDTAAYCDTIEAYGKPSVNFSCSNTATCVGNKINFFDLSYSQNGRITKWLWNFGDGQIDSIQNPTHIFTNRGIYNISLLVYDEKNCFNSKTLTNYINIQKPLAAFEAINIISCEKVQEVQFFNNSIGENLYFYWDFGNGYFSNEQNPKTYYTKYGTYDISLVAIDNIGCRDTITKKNFIKNYSINSQFIITSKPICPKSLVKITNKTENSSEFLWYLNDSLFSTETNPNIRIPDSGNYKIKLIAKNNFGCSDTLIRNIKIPHIKADFSTNSQFSCSLPFEISFVNNSENADYFLWKFSNNTYSTLVNPTVVINKLPPYSDTLIAFNNLGCSDTIVKKNIYNVAFPYAYFEPNNLVNSHLLNGCVPHTINFKNLSYYNTNQDSIIEYTWEFGDGATSNEQNPSHTFNSLNSFLIKLKVKTFLGCESQYFAVAKTGHKQHASFIYVGPDTICASQNITLISNSTDSNLIDSYHWIIGTDTFFTKKINIKIKDTGNVIITHLVGHNGCFDDTVASNIVFVKGPVSVFTEKYNCADPKKVLFFGKIIQAESFYWDFGDNSELDSININPIHIYNDTGTYTVKLYSINNQNNCTYEYTKKIEIIDAQPIISINDSIFCVNWPVYLDASQSWGHVPFIYNNELTKYLWIFGDNSPAEATYLNTINHIYRDTGNFLVRLIVKDKRNCFDTAFFKIKIYKPRSQFLLSIGNNACTGDTITAINNSHNIFPIIEKKWTIFDTNYYNIDTIHHVFKNRGTYFIRLEIVDERYCEDIYEKKISIHKPNADFYVNKNKNCINENIYFYYPNQLTPLSNIYFNLGDGYISDKLLTKYSYNQSGIYTLFLKLIDVFGCSDSIRKENFIDIADYPIADFIADTPITVCYPKLITFTNLTNQNNLILTKWDFHPFGNSTNENPSVMYNIPGEYDVSLIVKNTHGCSDTVVKSKYIKINGPYGYIACPDTICKKSIGIFEFRNPQNVYDIIWFMGDGYSYKQYSVQHSYNIAETYNPIVFVRTDSINTCNKFFWDTTTVRDIQVKISVSDTIKCQPAIINFTDSTKYRIKSLWEIENDNFIDTNYTFSYYFFSSGKKKITLISTDKYHCTDTNSIFINILPPPKIDVINDTNICRGTALELWANGGIYYLWTPNYYINNQNIPNPIVTPPYSTKYNVTVTDEYGCKESKDVFIIVHQPPEFFIKDTTIVIGDSIVLNNFHPLIKSYKWISDAKINCDTCYEIKFSTTFPTTLKLIIEDTAGCFELSKIIFIDVDEKYTIDVPQAFTPNGDGINDVVFVKGWGIDELIEFKVYNRYNQVVFSTNNKFEGWDGTYNNKPLPADTYIYKIIAKWYNGQIIKKTGTILLIR